MLKCFIRLFAIGLFAMPGLLSAQSSASRTWTAEDGRTLQGELTSATDSVVTVRRPGGRTVNIPLERLAEEDRSFVAEHRERLARQAAGDAEKDAAPRRAHLTYQLSDGSENWEPARRKQITEVMDAAVALYNRHGVFKKHVTANHSPGTPTADANFNGWINFGGSCNVRVALHEISHTLGVGTHPAWQRNIKDGKWTGRHALRQLREFDGPEATLSADRMHFWPYGLNYDNESSPENDIRHVKMVAALRKDMELE